MGVLALMLGILGGLCMIAGILTAAEVMSPIYAAFTGIFWLGLAGIFFIAAVTCLVARSSE